MAFTYDPAAISPAGDDPTSAVRFLLQDTVEAEAELTDEEIGAIFSDTDDELAQTQRVYLAAAYLAGVVARKYARQVDFSSGGTSVSATKRAELWRAVATELSAQAGSLLGAGTLEVIPAVRPANF